MDLAIIPECYVDTNLIEALVPPSGKGYNHQHGCGTVTKVMQEKFYDRFALGIIDKDKAQVKYLDEFNLIVEKESLRLFRHPYRHHYIIQIVPAVESFILANAAAINISPALFLLPVTVAQLTDISKTLQSKSDYRFKRLFKTVHSAGAPGFVLLAGWVRHLRDVNYAVDISVFNT